MRPWTGRATLAGALVGWALVSTTSWARCRSIAPPQDVAQTLLRDLLRGTLGLDLLATATRVFVGTTLALLLGGTVGMALGLHPRLRRALGPLIDLVRSIPPILVYPLLLLSLGYGEAPRLGAIVFGALGVVIVPVAQAVAETPAVRRDIFRLAGLGTLDTLRLLDLPQAAGALSTAARLALAQALVVALVTEMLVTPPRGLGSVALGALQEYRPDRLWMVMLLVGGASAAASAAFGRALPRPDPAPPRPLELTLDKSPPPAGPLWLQAWSPTPSSPSASSRWSECTSPTATNDGPCSTPPGTTPSGSPPGPSSSTS